MRIASIIWDLHIQIRCWKCICSLWQQMRKEKMRFCVEYAWLDTWISSESYSWRCEVNSNLFCWQLQWSLVHSAKLSHLFAKTPVGLCNSPPTGKTCRWSGWNKMGGWLCACRPCTVCSLTSSYVTKNDISRKYLHHQSYSRGVGWLQALGYRWERAQYL